MGMSILKQIREQNWTEYRGLLLQFLKFGIVGVSNTAVSLGVYYFFLWINPDLYLFGSVCGGIISIANAFIWNDRFVFKGNDNDWKSRLKRLWRTYISYGGTSLLGLAILWLEVDVLKIGKAIAPLIGLVITVPLNFAINKLWTFRKSEQKGNTDETTSS